MGTTWDKKRSEWYCSAVELSNYPVNAVSALSHLLRECEGVADIGAGCGALSLPIAGKVRRVSAYEPSRWMFELLRKRSRSAGIRNIRAYQAGWKKGSDLRDMKPHDMVICANLPQEIVCSRAFLRHIMKSSKKYIVYLQNAGGWNRFYYRELYPLLLNREYVIEGDYINTYDFLHEQGILANVRIFEYSLDQPFQDFDEALDFWKHRLATKLTPNKERLLQAFLKKKLVHSDKYDCLIAPFGVRRAALTWWAP